MTAIELLDIMQSIKVDEVTQEEFESMMNGLNQQYRNEAERMKVTSKNLEFTYNI